MSKVLPDAEVQIANSSKPEAEQNGQSDDYRDYIDFMDSKLRCDNFEVLLLCTQEDLQEARKFKEDIQRNSVVTFAGKRHNPVVTLEGEFIQDNDPVRHLDQAYKKALYLFVFVTKHFCDQNTDLFKAYAFLKEALEDKKWSVVPVRTEDKETEKKKGYKIPILLKHLDNIPYWYKSVYIEVVRRKLSSKMNLFEEMNLELEDRREAYFYKHKEKLKKMKSISNRRYNRAHMGSSLSALNFPVEEEGIHYEDSRTTGRSHKKDDSADNSSSTLASSKTESARSAFEKMSLESNSQNSTCGGEATGGGAGTGRTTAKSNEG